MILLRAICVWLVVINLVGVMIGLENRLDDDSGCSTPIKRIEILFPGFRAGCFIGSDLQEEKR